ncbi:hypothetical protein LNV07_15980 [Paucibacter oligotrophus]|uniref:Uncharacterized protein n=1 Tax=Roseateles oligotrophus TaxID=1769250 RepID=A0ABT2YHS6_9BURK|nr:hypothetical protein [Roseateles oligotrophus]
MTKPYCFIEANISFSSDACPITFFGFAMQIRASKIRDYPETLGRARATGGMLRPACRNGSNPIRPGELRPITSALAATNTWLVRPFRKPLLGAGLGSCDWIIIMSAANRVAAKRAEEKAARLDSLLAYEGKCTADGDKIRPEPISLRVKFTGLAVRSRCGSSSLAAGALKNH